MTELTRLTADETAAAIAAGEVSAVEVARAHLDRIGAVDDRVHAFLHVDTEGALAQAKRVDAGEFTGPLAGVRILDLCVAGPGPFGTLILASYGADVIHIARTGRADPITDSTHQNAGKRSIQIDLKSKGGREIVSRLVREADIVMEGFRPGVMERLQLGPGLGQAGAHRPRETVVLEQEPERRATLGPGRHGPAEGLVGGQ